MHTVVETGSYMKAARDAGMSPQEMEAVVTLVAENPLGGAQIAGTGGCRKLRVPKSGRGKSGGYRVISFYTGQAFPAFLLTVFAKNEKDNLTRAERNALMALTKDLVSKYANKR